MYKFERFEQTGSTFVPKMSIRTNGAVGISQGALRRFHLEEGDWYVILHFDREHNAIGILLTQDASGAGATKIVKREVKSKAGAKNITAYFSAKSFLEYYNIPYKDHIRLFEPTWDDEHKMVIVDLNQEKGGKA